MEGTIFTLGAVTASSSDCLITPTPKMVLGVTQTWWMSTGLFVRETRRVFFTRVQELMLTQLFFTLCHYFYIVFIDNFQC